MIATGFLDLNPPVNDCHPTPRDRLTTVVATGCIRPQRLTVNDCDQNSVNDCDPNSEEDTNRPVNDIDPTATVNDFDGTTLYRLKTVVENRILGP